MSVDILVVIILLTILLIFYIYNEPPKTDKAETFTQDKLFEPENAFDLSANSQSGDENHGKAFSDENDEKKLNSPATKSQVIIFFGKHCPHCIHYDRDQFPRLKGKLNKLGNKNITLYKVFSDKDVNGLFNKYDIQFVPSAIVISNGKSTKVSGEISPSNVI